MILNDPVWGVLGWKDMKTPFLVTLYYALASIIGLILTVVGAVTLLNLVLTTYVLKIPKYPSMPPEPYLSAPLPAKQLDARNPQNLTDEEKESLAQWKDSYARWQKEQASYDQEGVEKKRTLAMSFSLLAVGIPVLLLHQKELRKKI
jgi:hypothetical protein